MIDSDDDIHENHERIASVAEEFFSLIRDLIISKFSELGTMNGSKCLIRANEVRAIRAALIHAVCYLDEGMESENMRFLPPSDQNVKH